MIESPNILTAGYCLLQWWYRIQCVGVGFYACVCTHDFLILLMYHYSSSHHHHFLRACIQECYRKTHCLEVDLRFQCRQPEFALQLNHFQKLECHCICISNHESQKSKTTQIRKFDTLLGRSHDRYRQSPLGQWVVNLSSKPLNQPQQSVLAERLNFAVTPKHISTPKIVASVEDALRRAHLLEETTDKARSQIIGALRKARTTTPNLHPSKSKALRELCSDTNLMILPADKGRTTVVMDKTSYNTKVASMLSDTSTYKPLPKDPTPALQRKMKSLLLSLHKSGHLPVYQYNKLHDSADHIPLLYSLPKTHKPDVPLMPIVSFVSSPTYIFLLYPSSKHSVQLALW